MTDKPENFELYEQVVRVYGKENQMRIAQEECAELIVAISKYLRKDELKTCQIDPRHRRNLAEEIADVKIMLEQITLFVNGDLVNKFYDEKIKRLWGVVNK